MVRAYMMGLMCDESTLGMVGESEASNMAEKERSRFRATETCVLETGSQDTACRYCRKNWFFSIAKGRFEA